MLGRGWLLEVGRCLCAETIPDFRMTVLLGRRPFPGQQLFQFLKQFRGRAVKKEIDLEIADEAFEEALRRYPDAHGALIFLWGASGLGFRNPTEEQMERARKRWGNRAA
jgi:hypothetical protein